jgi:hypothetical protein
VVTLSFGEVENALRKAFEQAKTASGAAMALQLGSALKVLLSMLDDLKAEVGKLQKAENEILARRGIPQSGNIKTVLNGLEQADNLKAEVNALEAKVKESKFASKQEQVAGISRKLDEIFGVSGSS